MAADCVESFVKPIRCLYDEYTTTIEIFKRDNGMLVNDYDIEDLGDDPNLKLYAEFSDENDGELAREGVQTWICDHRLEVNNCIRIALDNKKVSFCNWFRSSEQFSSPDELLLYCLAKQTRKHVCIFNAHYVWSTLSNHINYDYFEVLKKSIIALLYLGTRHYGILRKKSTVTVPDKSVNNKQKDGKGRRSSTSKSSEKPKKKTTCRTSGKKSTTALNTGSRARTLQASRKEKYGIGSKIDTEKYGRGKRAGTKTIDYLKLNDGLDALEDTPASPKRLKVSSHVPIRSGPSAHRQTAQKTVTASPKVTTRSTVKSKKSQEDEAPTLIGVQTDETAGSQAFEHGSSPGNKDQGGEANTLLDVQTVNMSGSHGTAKSTDDDRPTLGVTDAFFGVSDSDFVLPDLGQSPEVTISDVLNQTQEAHSTEEELDAADTLLSLSNVRTTEDTSLGHDALDDLDDNAMLMPIGGGSNIEDVAPVPVRLGQVDVDEGIAQMLAQEDHDRSDLLSGVQKDGEHVADSDTGVVKSVDTEFPEVPDIQESSKNQSTLLDDQSPSVDLIKTKQTDSVTKKGSRGAFKSQLFGLKRPEPKDRSYKCKLCDVSKRSMEDLNAHHRRRHGKQTCDICGKKFNLATTLAHHLYSHFPRKFYCERCDFHCRFQSELNAHMISHREQPSHQCMYPKCGRWFKRKGELSLHVEVHNKLWYDCSKCDFSTKLVKYLKEHQKSHNKELPYSCDLCGQRFLWRSGVKRHKEKDHKNN